MTRRRTDLVVMGGGLGVLVVCAIPASSGRIGSLERNVFDAINGMPDALEPFAQAARYLGVLAVGSVVAAAALVARRPRLALAALLATAGKLLAERAFWEVVQRERPTQTQPSRPIIRGPSWSLASGALGDRGGRRGRRGRPYLPRRPQPTRRDVMGGLGLGLTVGAIVNLAVGVPRRVDEYARG